MIPASERRAALIKAMHQAAAERGMYVSAWHTLAQREDALRDAMRALFRGRMPALQKLGQWLTENAGAKAGVLMLEGKPPRSSKGGKGWAYRIVDLERQRQEAAQRAQAEAELRAQIEAQTAAAREARKAAAMPPTLPTIEYEFETKVDGAGHVTKVPLLNRDGSLRERRPETPAAPPAKPPEPEKPRTRVEEWRAKYLEHHQNITGGQGGFADPGGVVTRNISREGSRLDERTRRLRLLDF